jgi:hypothetical protein
MIRDLKLKKQLTLLVCCGIFGILLQYGMNYDLIDSNLPHKYWLKIYRNGLFFCFPFIMTGYFINKFSFHKRHINWLFLLVLGVFLLLMETFINYKYNGKSFDILLSLYLLCPVLFIYALNKEFYSTRKTLSLYATGIYLTHVYILLTFREFGLLSNIPSVKVFVVFLLSMLLTFFLIKLKKKFNYIL